ncbi:Peroxin/Ferlin domain [Plasmopara halstedii]|uniref:Peroxin/Ferlin domain n=1 Tax=Plasmopara halstedii TaxID=4781 RepID=A0A0P1AV52_PLAHL|nr:Peroxin/Ferlin domain [Plasmopara halstedii]CEG46253.1 Peroxin/Ferlin domain [Plasmopara halstedii]|eukprot:XP_024582622.1 Peroxin/Ferlin domain [Plasmopara halstedii]
MAEGQETLIQDISKENVALGECDVKIKMTNWYSRLRAFYWAHDPRKVDYVESILTKHRGKEEEFIQQVHREFGVRDFSGEEAIDDIYEHQRYSYLSFSWGSSLPGHLLPTDRHRWSGLHGSPSSQTREKVEPQLPVNWSWTGDWVIDKISHNCDIDGWVYALDFTMVNYHIKKGEERSEPNATDYVRRRRWVRTRRRANPPISLLEAACNDNKDKFNGSSQVNHWDVDAEKSGKKYDVNVETIEHSAVKELSNIKQAESQTSNILKPPIKLEKFSLDMDEVAFDAAWKVAVQDLEEVYKRANVQQAKQKQIWAVKKDKLRRQISLLEKTIASMQAIATEEQKRQRGKRHKDDYVPSPTNESLPAFTSIDSPTNAVNLAARMLCAQSKLDALRRCYWHPRESGYSLRFSIDGIYYGLRDFFVESFESTYSLQISHQANGAQGITPTCKVSMNGRTVCCGKHVKVVGEKGTRIPKSLWDSMYMNTDFTVSMNLIYVEDLDDASELGQGKWEFLLSTEATYVELLNFKRRVKGGMDLPEPMVRKLCSDVLTSLVRDLTLLYFPYELALAFKLPPAKLNIQGEIKIIGLSIDHVMEKELYECDVDVRDDKQARQKEQQSNDARKSHIPEASSTSPQNLLRGLNNEMQTIAEILRLSRPQFNLLIAMKDSGLFPAAYPFHSLASICSYYKAFSDDKETIHNDEVCTQEEKLRTAWKSLIELIFIQKNKARMLSPKNVSRRSRWPLDNRRTENQVELFDVDNFFDVIKRLSKKPVSIHLSVKHFHLTINVLNAVEALTKLYERIILGIDYSKPRVAADGFIYGIRLGRKAAVYPTMNSTSATSAAATLNGEMHSVSMPPILNLRQYRPAEDSFQMKVQLLSSFRQTLKNMVDYIRDNIDNVSVELAGNLKATDEDCVLNGSFKDANFCGSLNLGFGVSPCFLGFYRAEIVTLGINCVGMQVDVMLPSSSSASTITLGAKHQSFKALEYAGRLMLADISSQVYLDLNALLAHEKERRKLRSSSIEINVPSCGSSQQSVVKGATQKNLNKFCALSFSFGPANDLNQEKGTEATSQLNVGTSKFTKLHTTAKLGSFTISLLSIAEYLLAHYVQPYVLKGFPQHLLFFNSMKSNLMALLLSPTFETEFNIMIRLFIHEDENLMVTCCGSPLHPTPVIFQNEAYLLDIILQADDLVNIWIDDCYPPYSNPLYF